MRVGVTGITGGIGQAVNELFGKRGADIIGFARQPGPLQYLLDVTMHESEISRRIGEAAPTGYDVWINLAGADILSGDNRKKSYLERLQRLWDVDVLGTIKCSRAVIPYFQNTGTIINVAWDEALSGAPGDSASLYGTAKAAILGFSASFAKSVMPKIRVYVLSPGWVATRWAKSLTEEQKSRVIQQSASKKWIAPEDVAEALWEMIHNSPPSGTIMMVN
ncbi:SDR family oxidoreductase [Sulfobacillus thermosulfidooxidans]|uniref:SDR family oxidoreductase n=1 Tax=Sulfobacillus thermosulfidooxidans TaxID=28034 RepID=UPI0006B5D1D9|nr:SDR family oxidoreductase [Sulfobacillus thermosulfidooxidans]